MGACTSAVVRGHAATVGPLVFAQFGRCNYCSLSFRYSGHVSDVFPFYPATFITNLPHYQARYYLLQMCLWCVYSNSFLSRRRIERDRHSCHNIYPLSPVTFCHLCISDCVVFCTLVSIGKKFMKCKFSWEEDNFSKINKIFFKELKSASCTLRSDRSKPREKLRLFQSPIRFCLLWLAFKTAATA